MQSPFHYIILLMVGILAGYCITFIKPREKLIWWSTQLFIYHVENPAATIYNWTITIKNMGRRPAENIEITHPTEPNLITINPPRDVGQKILPDGSHVIFVENLGSKEALSVGLLNINAGLELPIIRSKWGIAKHKKDPSR